MGMQLSRLLVLLAISSASVGCAMLKSNAATGDPSEFFMVMANQMNHAEIATGRLAVERAGSSEVRQFGQRMIDDHTRANEALLQLAERKGVALPGRADEQHVLLAKHLSELRGAAFDREYMSHQTAGHARGVSLFQDKAKMLDDAEVRAFATSLLPTMENHLRMAQGLNQRLGGSTGPRRGG